MPQAKSTAIRLAIAKQRHGRVLPEGVGKFSKSIDAALPGKHTRNLYDRLKRKEAGVLAQLRTGMARLNGFLSRIGCGRVRYLCLRPGEGNSGTLSVSMREMDRSEKRHGAMLSNKTREPLFPPGRESAIRSKGMVSGHESGPGDDQAGQEAEEQNIESGFITQPRETSDSIYIQLPMKALIPVQRLRLGHVLVGLPCLLSTLPLHKQFQAAVIQSPIATNPSTGNSSSPPSSPTTGESARE